MSVIDTMVTASTKLTDSSSDPYPVDFFYGMDEWKTIDTMDQDKDFIYVDPISGRIPAKDSGFLREDYSISLLFGRCVSLDLSKEQERDIIWQIRPYALQYLRRLLAETNTNGAKLFFPLEDGSIREVRKFLATNVYGVNIEFTLKERFPSETC